MRKYARAYNRGYLSKKAAEKRETESEYLLMAAGAEDLYIENPAKRKAPKKKQAIKHKRRIRSSLTPGIVIVMTAALVAMAVSLFQYIYLNSEITYAASEIAQLEEELKDLRSENDEALNAIESNINLDEIKYKAMAKLGMTYPDEDQVIHYEEPDNDYVRQFITE